MALKYGRKRVNARSSAPKTTALKVRAVTKVAVVAVLASFSSDLQRKENKYFVDHYSRENRLIYAYISKTTTTTTTTTKTKEA